LEQERVNVVETLIGFWNPYIDMNEQNSIVLSLSPSIALFKITFQEEKFRSLETM
jgi:hypothetical protein